MGVTDLAQETNVMAERINRVKSFIREVLQRLLTPFMEDYCHWFDFTQSVNTKFAPSGVIFFNDYQTENRIFLLCVFRYSCIDIRICLVQSSEISNQWHPFLYWSINRFMHMACSQFLFAKGGTSAQTPNAYKRTGKNDQWFPDRWSLVTFALPFVTFIKLS